MKRIFKILGLAMVLTTILVVALAGTAFAASPNIDKGTQNQGEVQPCGDCVSVDCVPNDYSYSNDWNYLTSGPHTK